LKIYRSLDNIPEIPFPVVSMGTFDGVHIGHQTIIKKVKECAQKNNGESVVITFDPHPRIALHLDEENLKLLTSLKEKIYLFERNKIDNLIILPFTKEFSELSANDFIKDYIVGKLKTKILVIGYDHHFGNNRKADPESIYELSKKYNFDIEKVGQQKVLGHSISSTKIRDALVTGDIEKANELLGYEYVLSGEVIYGNQIGRTIGFPTANIFNDNRLKQIPANGVYAVKVNVENKIYTGMCNIGVRPTIDHGDLTVEINIFDFDKDIYGEKITVFFYKRIRSEKKFPNITALKEQLAKDKEEILKLKL